MGPFVNPHGATPHTRGSTAMIELADAVDAGYPAYAGIDPMRLMDRGLGLRLPRIRGDRPKGR